MSLKLWNCVRCHYENKIWCKWYTVILKIMVQRLEEVHVVMQGPSMNRVDSLKGINLYYSRDTNLTLYLALKLVLKMLWSFSGESACHLKISSSVIAAWFLAWEPQKIFPAIVLVNFNVKTIHNLPFPIWRLTESSLQRWESFCNQIKTLIFTDFDQVNVWSKNRMSDCPGDFLS